MLKKSDYKIIIGLCIFTIGLIQELNNCKEV